MKMLIFNEVRKIFKSKKANQTYRETLLTNCADLPRSRITNSGWLIDLVLIVFDRKIFETKNTTLKSDLIPVTIFSQISDM
jgi:hypothetical protein